MKLSPKVLKMEEIIRPAVEACGVNLWGIELLPQGKKSMLRVYIDRPDQGTPQVESPTMDMQEADQITEAVQAVQTEGKGVSADDCARVSHQVSGVLDVHDPISGEYTLEVSSPGWDRPFFSLDQMVPYLGQKVQVRLIAPVNNRRNFTGQLQQVTPEAITLEVEGTPHVLDAQNIDRAHLVY